MKDITKSYLSDKEYAEGITYHGFSARAGIIEFYAWIIFGILNHKDYDKFSRDVAKIYEERLSSGEVKKAFEQLGQKPPQTKTIQNKLPFFKERVLPLINEESDFSAGFNRAYTEHGNLLLQDPKIPATRETCGGTLTCDKCGQTRKHK